MSKFSATADGLTAEYTANVDQPTECVCGSARLMIRYITQTGLPQDKLTLVRTESVFAVFIKVVGGGAPQEAVVAALRRAAVVFSTHEREGEFTKLPISVAVFHLHHCWKKKSKITTLA